MHAAATQLPWTIKHSFTFCFVSNQLRSGVLPAETVKTIASSCSSGLMKARYPPSRSPGDDLADEERPREPEGPAQGGRRAVNAANRPSSSTMPLDGLLQQPAGDVRLRDTNVQYGR